MKTKIVDVFAVFTSNSEHGYPDGYVGIFTTRKEAEVASKGKGWWGGSGTIEERKALVLDDEDVYLLDVYCNRKTKINTIELETPEEKRKKRALAKLTKEDKEILGIEED